MNCADKFLKHSERVGQRFAELNAGTLHLSSAPRIQILIRDVSSEAMGPKP
jgi:hypothetical protein